jgi:hypothetical protein
LFKREDDGDGNCRVADDGGIDSLAPQREPEQQHDAADRGKFQQDEAHVSTCTKRVPDEDLGQPFMVDPGAISGEGVRVCMRDGSVAKDVQPESHVPPQVGVGAEYA